LLKNAFPFKTLESMGARAQRIARDPISRAGEFFGDLPWVSARSVLDLAGVRSGLIEKRSRSRVPIREPPHRELFHASLSALGGGEGPILSLAVDREGKDQ
jgi:hypothetical protein